MRDETQRLRAALAGRERGRGKRFSPEIRRRIAEVGSRLRDEGASWLAIAADLGLPRETVRRLCEDREAEFAAVEVVGEPHTAGAGVVVVTPAGFRVEGLTAESAAALLRALA